MKTRFLITIFAVFLALFLFEIYLPPKKVTIQNGDSSLSKDLQESKEDEQKTAKENITIIAVGDIMLSRTVADEILKHNDPSYPFLKTAEILKAADLTFGNLENPITPGPKILIQEMRLRADPTAVEGLKFAGFDVLSLANNHFGDFGEKGMLDTFKFLEEGGIDFAGAGRNKNEAHSASIKEVKGIKIGFLAYSDSTFTQKSYEAGEEKSGIALMNKEDLKLDIEKAKKEVDFLIVSMHAGKEYEFSPSSWQKEFGEAAIDSGADLIIGHHPHILQPYTIYKGKYIFYSLGNFVFDQETPKQTKESVILKIDIVCFPCQKTGLNSASFQIDKIEPIAVSIKKYSQPEIAEQNKEEILKNFYLLKE